MDLKAFTPGNGNKNVNSKTSFLFHLTDGVIYLLLTLNMAMLF